MTRLIQFANNAVSRLAANISNSATSLSLTPGDGAKFPAVSAGQYFMATLVRTDGTTEVVKVTARSTDTLTVVRSAEAVGGASVPYSFTAGDKVEARLTSGGLGSELDRLDAAALLGSLNKTNDYTVTSADISTLVRVDTSSHAVTITLPDISTLTSDFDMIVAKVTGDANAVSVVRSGTDLVNGAANYPLALQWNSIWLIADRSTNTWTAINSGLAGSNVIADAGTGSGSATVTLTGEPGSKNNTAFFVGGVYQQKASYSLSGSTITAGGAIGSGVAYEVIWSQPLAIGATTADLVRYTPAGAGAVARTAQDKMREGVSVLDFGADPTGVADSAPAIRLAIAYFKGLGFGGEIVFPRGKYRITSTIEVADMRGVRFTGALGSINTSNATVAEAITDSYIFWDGPNSTDPLFYFARGHNNTFEHLVFKGMQGVDSVQRAYVGIWIDENHENYRFYDCKFSLFSIGIRVCSSYNHSTTAWTGGTSAYSGFYSAAAASFGGFASDNGSYINCSFGGNTIAGISIESAQALDMKSDKCLFIQNAHHVFIAACQGLVINSPTFLIDGVAAIYVVAQASTGNIVVNQSHTESGVNILYECSNASSSLGNGIAFNQCGGGAINIRGASGTVVINGCTLTTVSMKSAGVSLVIADSTLQSLDKTVGLSNGPLLRLSNVTVSGSISANSLTYTNLELSKVTFPAWTEFANVPKRLTGSSYGPDLLLGEVSATSQSGGMDGVAFSAGNNYLLMGFGCYLNAAGAWVATETSGGSLSLTSTGIMVSKFAGATIGAAPSFAYAFTAETSAFGMYLPKMTADSAPVGAGNMYYNTTTGKFRLHDAVGWRDL